MKGHLTARPIGARPWRGRRWLVLAPHPDDETLGAGALIAQTSRTGCLAGVVYLTDGSASHPSPHGRAGRLAALREREAKLALRRLTKGRKSNPVFLGWKDAAPEVAGQPAFQRSSRILAALCVRLRVDVLATTAPQEPHCDHAAAAQLAAAVQAMSRRRLALGEYVVWGVAPPSRSHIAVMTAPMPPGTRRHALASHRSQLTASNGAGFRLPRDKRTMPSRDILYIRRR